MFYEDTYCYVLKQTISMFNLSLTLIIYFLLLLSILIFVNFVLIFLLNFVKILVVLFEVEVDKVLFVIINVPRKERPIEFAILSIKNELLDNFKYKDVI